MDYLIGLCLIMTNIALICVVSEFIGIMRKVEKERGEE